MPTRRHRIRILPFLSYPFGPRDLSWFGLKRRIHSHTTVVSSKTIPDCRPKWAKYIPFFRPNRRTNHTVLGAAHTYMAYIREYSPRADTWFRSLLSVHTKKPWRKLLPACRRLLFPLLHVLSHVCQYVTNNKTWQVSCILIWELRTTKEMGDVKASARRQRKLSTFFISLPPACRLSYTSTMSLVA